MNIYYPCDVNPYVVNNYFEYLDRLSGFLEKIKDLDNIDNVHLVSRNDIEYGCEIGKLKRNKLLELSSIYSPYEVQNKGYSKIITEMISKKLNREVVLNKVGNYFIFPKSIFSDIDIARILSLFKVLDYKEDNDNRYLAISDLFLFSKKKNQFIDNHEEINYIAAIRNNNIRDYLIKKNNIIYKAVVKFGFFHEEDNRFSSVISAYEVNLKKKDDNMSYFLHYDSKIEKELIAYLELNQYEAMCGYAVPKYSIDDENNFYVNDEKVELNSLSCGLYHIMYDLLIKNKFDKSEIKPKAKRKTLYK